jgi:hypothetical protein
MRSEIVGSPEAAASSVLDALCRVEMTSREHQLELAEWLKDQINDCMDNDSCQSVEAYAEVLRAFMMLLYDDTRPGNDV